MPVAAISKKSHFKNIVINLSCLGVILGLLFTGYLFRYRAFLKGLGGYAEMTSASYSEPVFPKLSLVEVANLGWAHRADEHPKSSYINFPEQKPEGMIRIGTFGDSNTAGSEAASPHDYPTFLQEEFRKAGINHVEVINFGVGSFGVHQSFLIWEYLAKKYGLDYVLFMPYDFHMERDATFIKSLRSYAGIHARYIFKGDSLELAPVVGQNRMEASKKYFSAIPPWRYLRYDRKTPTFLRALLPADRELKTNPFYYQLGLSLEEEMLKSYAWIFDELSKQVKNVIIISHEKGIRSLEKKLTSPNIFFFDSQIRKDQGSNLYRAPKGHFSALGNQLRAKEIFSLLTGQDKFKWNIFQISEAPLNESAVIQHKLLPLYQYRLTVAIADDPVASFVSKLTDKSDQELGDNPQADREAGDDIDFRKHRISALIQTSAKDLIFIPVSFLLPEQESVFISFKLDKQWIKIPIGTLQTKGGVLGKISLLDKSEEKSFSRTGEGWSLTIWEKDFLNQVFIQTDKTVKKLSLLIGDKKILTGKQSSSGKNEKNGVWFSFQPAIGSFMNLRAKAGQFIDLDTLERKSGPLTLWLERTKMGKESLPLFLKYEVVPSSFDPFEKEYPNKVSVTP